MANIIVAFSKPEDGKNIRNILMRNGYQVDAVCTSGAQTVNQTEDRDGGIIVCGYHFADMQYEELFECVPETFDMLLVTSATHLGDSLPERIIGLAMPLKVHDLLDTLEMMLTAQIRKNKRRKQKQGRSEEDKNFIKKAKELLINRNHMTEEEAHKYLQKCSMDSGTNLVETAQMVISLNS